MADEQTAAPAAPAGTLMTSDAPVDAPPASAEGTTDAPPAEPADAPVPPVDGSVDAPPPAEDPEGNTEEPALEYELEFPEGAQVDEEAAGELNGLVKELKLPKEQAQKFAELAAKASQKWAADLQQHIVDTRTGWVSAVKSDTEIGGDNLQPNLAVAKTAIESFGTPELKALLDDTGLGDNPEFIRFAYRVGKANSEHDFVNAGKPAREVKFYDHPSSQPKG